MFIERLRAGEPVVGAWVTVGHPVVAEVLAPEFDFLAIDAEHTESSIETVAAMVRAIDATDADCAALVRVSDNDPVEIKRVLDLGVAGVVLVGAVGMMYRSMSEEDVVVPSEDIDDEPDLDEFAAAAGRAADRIEEHAVDVDNAVYRAWVEMTDLIEVDNPDVYSPGEFAETAVDLGMDESDVSELTNLFNEVRYGDRDASTREDRAVSVLRNIESAYSGAGSAATDTDPRTNGSDDQSRSSGRDDQSQSSGRDDGDGDGGAQR